MPPTTRANNKQKGKDNVKAKQKKRRDPSDARDNNTTSLIVSICIGYITIFIIFDLSNPLISLFGISPPHSQRRITVTEDGQVPRPLHYIGTSFVRREAIT